MLSYTHPSSHTPLRLHHHRTLLHCRSWPLLLLSLLRSVSTSFTFLYTDKRSAADAGAPLRLTSFIRSQWVKRCISRCSTVRKKSRIRRQAIGRAEDAGLLAAENIVQIEHVSSHGIHSNNLFWPFQNAFWRHARANSFAQRFTSSIPLTRLFSLMDMVVAGEFRHHKFPA